MPDIRSLSGNTPHDSWGGWDGFLSRACKVMGQADGVTHYAAVNCNYILFPDGSLVENFGFKGRVLMDKVREKGWKAALHTI